MSYVPIYCLEIGDSDITLYEDKENNQYKLITTSNYGDINEVKISNEFAIALRKEIGKV